MSVMVVLLVPLLAAAVIGIALARVPVSPTLRRRLQWISIGASVLMLATLIASWSNVWWGAAAGVGLAAMGAARMRWAPWGR